MAGPALLSRPFPLILLLVDRVAGRTTGKGFPPGALRGEIGQRVSFSPFRPHRRMAPEAEGIPAFPQEVFPDPSMGPVTFPASASRKSGSMDSLRPGGITSVTSRAHGISPPPEGNLGAGEDVPSSFPVGGVTAGTSVPPRLLSARHRRGMLGPAPQGIPAVPDGPVVAACAHAFLVEPVDLFRECKPFVEKDALPDVAERAGFLGIDLLPLDTADSG